MGYIALLRRNASFRLLFLATLGRTPQAVAGFSSGILMPLAMIGGGMIPLMAMPPWMLRVSDLSPVKWGIYALEGAIFATGAANAGPR